MTLGASLFTQTLEGLLRASLWLALVLLPALALGALLLRHRPGARFLLLLGALLLAAPAPLYLAVARGAAAALLPTTWVLQPRGLARGLLDPVQPAVAPALAGRSAATTPPAGSPSRVPAALFLVWLGGVAGCLARLAHGLARVRGLRRRAVPWSPPGGAPAFPVLRSSEISGAAAVGLRRPAILVGQSLASGPPAALEQVLLHEVAHARRRDPLWGLCERLVQVIYWFHPLVWLCRRELARAREEACDDPVLARFAPAEYARTLLALAAAPGPRTPVAGAAGAHTAVARRIRRLLQAPVQGGGPARSRLLLALAALVGVGSWALVMLAPLPDAPRSVPQVWVSGVPAPAAVLPAAPEFAPAGPGAQGAFVLKELGGPTVVLNAPLASQRLTPASTFKLLIGLGGLESGAIPDAHTPLRWNGRPQAMAAWNQDHDLASAMRTSATWYFDDVLDRLDPQAVQQLLQRLHYGNQDAGGSGRRFWPSRSFWMDGQLRISAVEQAEALARLLEGESGASARSLELLASVTELGRDGDTVLHGKTGTAVDGGRTVAWLVGHVQRGTRRFTYATLMLAPVADGERLQKTRRGITEALLARHGAYGP